ncbi:putative alpha/beta hydrolase [Kineosphaera limosa]|uniref:Serine aminopeptidase S33 domain-containing protein n=1 Tax=Kineosphaera limosa NBRC 100340 TaxID=1184609 RepID=K6WJQ8_9MICO|nr:hypothetical protein [Kineosphaera limosa]NYE02174.1 putative alpha/beta hydrolase [Kineosphaera limosa]GAB94026.1 hypothetical protein KILIM_001_00280 [Kineosphaera limosa NBRC 100340]
MALDLRSASARSVEQPEEASQRSARLQHRVLTWLPVGERWLSVRVDEPDDRQARGALVIAPSFDREAVVSFRTTRALAARAREAGLLAYTFSWSGDGDSTSATGAAATDPAAAWEQELAAVVAHARRIVGPEAPVHIVGLRLGAAVLARVPRELTGPGQRLYWEPVSGAAFVRNHALIRRTSVPVPTGPGQVELDGAVLDPEQVASVRGLAAPKPAQLGPDDAIRTEPDRRAAMRLVLGAPYFAHVPLSVLTEIVAGLRLGPARPLPAWQPQTVATVRQPGPDGAPIDITETLCEVGPNRLPAIRTQAAAGDPQVAVLFTAMGAEVKAGPGSMWARAARDLATRGVVSLRADRGGIGDDADPDLAPEPRPYVPEAIEDVATAVRELASTGLPVLAVGVCAGAWALMRAAGPGYEAPLTELLGVNTVHWHPDPAVYTDAFYAHYHGQEAADRSAPAPSADEAAEPEEAQESAPALTLGERIARAKDYAFTELAIRYPRLRSALRHDVPLDLADPMLRQVPASLILTLLYGPHDHRIWVGKGGRRSLRRARKRGLPLTVVRDVDVDHSLFAQRAQHATLRLLRERTAALAALAPRRADAEGAGNR